MEAKRRGRNMRPHVPTDLVEKILLNLPVKTLLRFSSVSKSWNLMIFGRIAERYKGREMIVLRVHDQKSLVCPLSSVSTDTAVATPFLLPFTPPDPYYSDVSCGELRCVEFENTICLYNPSTRTYRKLPTPSCPPRIGSSMCQTSMSVFVYGLGFDSVCNDYKILKTHKQFNGVTELYSLKSDCWREISDSKRKIRLSMSTPQISIGQSTFESVKGVFVSGKLHWLVCNYWLSEDERRIDINHAILTFDLSTYEYGKLELPVLPESLINLTFTCNQLDVCVLRGRLCLCMNHLGRFVVWVMEDYGYGWNIDLEIDYSMIYPLCYSYLKPLYFYDGDGGNLIKAVICPTDLRKMFIFKDEDSTLVEKSFGSNGYGVIDTFTYVESFVSPYVCG